MKSKINYFLIVIFLTGIMSGCNPEKNDSVKANNDYLLLSTLFQQKAAERRALSYQAFNIAKLRPDNELRKAGLTLTLAVVVDIDETVLDNSPFEAKGIIENSDYPKYWDEWCALASARPLAGSVEFLNYAKSKGVVVFYITNRKINLLAVTLKNLKEKGFPYADEEHVLMKTDDSNKDSRRDIVTANHHIVFFMGDNLGDFMHVFDNKKIDERFSLTDKYKNEFGNKFIVLPNPMYGSWANELINNNYNLSKKEKIDLLKKQLVDF